MAYIITSLCTNDGACVEVCPVACIHTKPGAPQFYIDPEVCIDCEQCEIVCPVDAIFKDTDIPPEHQAAIETNAAFFRKHKTAAEPVPIANAWAMIRGAQDYASVIGVAVAVAIVDEAGNLIALSRMDGAQPAAAELAVSKAFTAAAFHLASGELAAQAREPWMRSLVVSRAGRILPAPGGIPILDGVTIVGAIGVAGGARADQDVLCCRAGLAALEGPAAHRVD
ncbi:MAG TPA: heme-binding protein [Candidatus Eisenbacteria bacterium]|nr:heme-binding protein [Candidatus Eisenbacteria bacterium]